MTATATSSGTFKIGGDLEVTRLGYGAMRITGEGIWGPPRDHDAAIAVLKRLPELGVDFIDTADSYGPFVSEDLIHEALHPYDRLTVATKAGLTRSGPVAGAAEAHGATPGQVALAWLLHRSPVMLPIPGTGSVEHLEENVAAAELDLGEDELRAIDEAAGAR